MGWALEGLTLLIVGVRGRNYSTDNLEKSPPKEKLLLGFIETKYCNKRFSYQTACSVRILHAWWYRNETIGITRQKEQQNNNPRTRDIIFQVGRGTEYTVLRSTHEHFHKLVNHGHWLISHQLGWTGCCIQQLGHPTRWMVSQCPWNKNTPFMDSDTWDEIPLWLPDRCVR